MHRDINGARNILMKNWNIVYSIRVNIDLTNVPKRYIFESPESCIKQLLELTASK